jgi:hypothetical protein
MNRIVIARAGALVALGFLCTSAIANYLFGASLGRTVWESRLYGVVGVLAVAMNALAPFFLSWSWSAARKTLTVSVAALWALCLIYSTTSALGFAAQNRETTARTQQITNDAYDDTRRELLDLERRRNGVTGKEKTRVENRIDDVRIRLTSLRNDRPTPADAQSTFISALTFGLIEPQHVRITLAALFALMIEMCATLGLFAALSHSFQKPTIPQSEAPRQKPRAPW